MARLEHVNVTVRDPQAFAQMLVDLFDWRIRWQGGAIDSGYSIHVGGDDSYLALYTGPEGAAGQTPGTSSYRQTGGLNHIGVVVDDLEVAETRVKTAGFSTHSHADYEPGRRFYFHGPDDIEIEVIAYD